MVTLDELQSTTAQLGESVDRTTFICEIYASGFNGRIEKNPLVNRRLIPKFTNTTPP